MRLQQLRTLPIVELKYEVSISNLRKKVKVLRGLFFSTSFAECFRPEQYKAIQPSIQPCPQAGLWERG